MKRLFWLFLVYATVLGQQSTDVCDQAKNCRDCMGAHPDCSWCYDDNFDDSRALNGPAYRCGTVSSLQERGCPADKIERTVSKEILQTDYGSSNVSKQLKPVERVIQLRPLDTITLNFTFKTIKNYPVDLYFLIDLSYTMKRYIDTISRMTQDIRQAMSRITDDLRVGFGAFVDKPIFPFIDPAKLYRPCEGDVSHTVIKCDPTFLFRHYLNLTTDFTLFQEFTRDPMPSGNLDMPEAGLDALLQVAHCTHHIGWRKEARKIVLLATDGSFHLAGDGRLAGLLYPPPDWCAMTYEAVKDEKFWGFHLGDRTDYPSIGEVARVLTKTRISVIFATTKEFEYIYQKLASFLPSSSVGIFEKDAENIVRLLYENYERIARKVDMSLVFSDSDAFNVKLLTRCHGEENFTEKTSCNEHPVSGTIDYQVQIQLKKCLAKEETIALQLVSLDEASHIRVKSQCECPTCDKMTWPQYPANPKCTNNGYVVCGTCMCNQEFKGDFCECPQQAFNETELMEKCRVPETKSICSGRGRCVCGRCKCSQPRYVGEHCECDIESCRRASDDNLVCGGPQRGECKCDRKGQSSCVCNQGYSNEACDCLESRSGCEFNGTTCSSNGFCDCGSCFCNPGWTGRLCNEVQGGESAVCQIEEVSNCVICLHTKHFEEKKRRNKNGENETKDQAIQDEDVEEPIYENAVNQCASECRSTEMDYENAHFIAASKLAQDGSNLCVVYESNNCRLSFTYRYSDIIRQNQKAVLKIIRDLNCVGTNSTIPIVIAVILAIVIGGVLILLIYKLVLTMSDRKVVASVEKRAKNSHWAITTNPTYANPSATINNPIYKGNL